MGKSSRSLLPTKKSKAPWIVLILLLLTIYCFFILPKQMGPRKVQTEYETANPK